MEETVVFIDEGFLDKLTMLFGDGNRIKYNKFEFAKIIAKKLNFSCQHMFYYTAPPFQGTPPTKDEIIKKKGYDKFISKLSRNKNITIREGRCQKIVNQQGEIKYSQKGVDTLLTIDLEHLKEDYSNIRKIILVSSDTDFCPAIKDIKQRSNINVLLYTYFDRKRKSKFSLSNELISCCSKYFKLTKEDFTSCTMNK